MEGRQNNERKGRERERRESMGEKELPRYGRKTGGYGREEKERKCMKEKISPKYTGK